MGTARKARKGYWRYDPVSRLGGNDETVVVQGRACPYCQNGVARHLAERQMVYPYHWIPVGYRCTDCGTIFADMEVKV